MKNKYSIGLIVIFVIVFAIVAARIVFEYHKKGILSDYKYDFRWIDNKPCAYITKYTGSKEVVTVPTKIGFLSVKEIDENTYKRNTTIKKIIIPAEFDGLLYFDNNDVLTTVEYAEGVEKLKGSFLNCKNLREVIIPQSTLYSDANFEGCESLEDVKFPENMRSVFGIDFEGTAFEKNHSDDKYYVVGDGVLLFYNGSQTDIVIPTGIKCVAADDILNDDSENKEATIYYPDTVKIDIGGLPTSAIGFYLNSDIEISDQEWTYYKGLIVAPNDSVMAEHANKYGFNYREITEAEVADLKEKTEAAASEIIYQK